MGSVKWYMFNSHFWSALLDFSLSFLVIPFMLFPLASGYGYGVLTWVGVSQGLQTTIIIIEIGLTILSILVMFENRYTFLVHSEEFWIRFRKGLIIILYVAAVTYIIPFNFVVPDQSIAVPALVQKYPALHISYTGPVFVFSQDSTLLVVVTATKLLIEFAFIILLVIFSFSNIFQKKHRKHLSHVTLTLQKKFLISITVQVAVPFFVILTPLFYVVFSITEQYHNQALNNISFLIISSHGIISTISMILIHKPYRDATFRCGTQIQRHRKTSISNVRIFME
ncbi:unnamed protein product [Caenorhabditis brenneri]